MSNAELPGILGSMMEHTVRRNLLKYAAGQHMFCRVCENVLDCRRTSIATVKDGDKDVRTYVTCSSCMAARMPHLKEAMSKANEKHPGHNFTVELIDGTIEFARPPRKRKAT
jgi:hypothetical protein